MQAHPTAQAYFKSTDGHHGNWAFNLRRPNIHLLPVAATHGGYVAIIHDFTTLSSENNKQLVSRLILVDSTRAGKRLPDALSKTVPIWCAVINRATCLRGSVEVEDLDLCTSPGAVSPHEHAQIATRLDSWAATLAVRPPPPPYHPRPRTPCP
jgi:tRNA A64-2'-O-ribosylphosphate transferase